jgi:hypothetical protein
MKRTIMIALAVSILTLALGLSACSRGPYPGKTYEGWEESEVVYVQDKLLRKALSIDNIQQQTLPHGALKVDVVIHNRLKKTVTIEAQTEFKNENNIGIGDETGWKLMVLEPLAAETYSALSTKTNAKKYTVHIRPSTK